MASGSATGKETDAESARQTREVTVRYFLVPEARAAEILANRWNADGDTALLESMLEKAGGSGEGLRLVRTHTIRCRSGKVLKLEEGYAVLCPNEIDRAGKGEVKVKDTFSMNVGSVEEMELTVSNDSELCDVNFSLEYDFAKPGMHRWSTSLEDPANKALPGLDQPEFRKSKVTSQILLNPGKSGLVQTSQLPTLPDAPEQQLFVFITVSKPEP